MKKLYYESENFTIDLDDVTEPSLLDAFIYFPSTKTIYSLTNFSNFFYFRKVDESSNTILLQRVIKWGPWVIDSNEELLKLIDQIVQSVTTEEELMNFIDLV